MVILIILYFYRNDISVNKLLQLSTGVAESLAFLVTGSDELVQRVGVLQERLDVARDEGVGKDAELVRREAERVLLEAELVRLRRQAHIHGWGKPLLEF